MKSTKQIWFELNQETPISVLEKVYQLEYSTIFLPFNLKDRIHKNPPPSKCKLAVLIETKEQLTELKKDTELLNKTSVVFVKNMDLKDEVLKQKMTIGYYMGVNDHASLHEAVRIANNFSYLLIHFKDPTNIPLELVLASTQKDNVIIMKRVLNAEDGKVSFQTMEHGSDSIVLANNDLNEVIALNKHFTQANMVKMNLVPAEVVAIKHAGMGERVCIDTTSELYADEGIVLGSTSVGGLVTCSETHYLPYMNTRPFRVNAGGLHLYAWGPNNMTYYLSDLKAGDELLVVNNKGDARTVTIGRMKIERRPLLYIEVKIGDSHINTFIQDDWHVRMMGSKGEIRPSSEIKIGDKLLGFLDKPGRHVGIQIEETIKEK